MDGHAPTLPAVSISDRPGGRAWGAPRVHQIAGTPAPVRDVQRPVGPNSERGVHRHANCVDWGDGPRGADWGAGWRTSAARRLRPGT